MNSWTTLEFKPFKMLWKKCGSSYLIIFFLILGVVHPIPRSNTSSHIDSGYSSNQRNTPNLPLQQNRPTQHNAVSSTSSNGKRTLSDASDGWQTSRNKTQNTNQNRSQSTSSSGMMNTWTNRAVNNRPNDDNSNSDSAIVCTCNQDAVLLTVRKEGPNTGNNNP